MTFLLQVIVVEIRLSFDLVRLILILNLKLLLKVRFQYQELIQKLVHLFILRFTLRFLTLGFLSLYLILNVFIRFIL